MKGLDNLKSELVKYDLKVDEFKKAFDYSSLEDSFILETIEESDETGWHITKILYNPEDNQTSVYSMDSDGEEVFTGESYSGLNLECLVKDKHHSFTLEVLLKGIKKS